MNAGAPEFCWSVEFTDPKVQRRIGNRLEASILNPSGDQKASA